MQTVEEVLEKLNDVIRQNKEDLRKTRTEYEGTIRACLKDCERADEEIKRLKGLSDYEKNALDHPAMMQMAEEHLAETEQMAERINSLQSQLAASEKKHRDIYYKTAHEVEQILGKALGCPWFKDDLKNFPDATEADGVCVGDHVPETIAAAAANRIKKLEAQLAASQKREEILLNGLQRYAEQGSWSMSNHRLLMLYVNHGFGPARKAIQKAEEVK